MRLIGALLVLIVCLMAMTHADPPEPPLGAPSEVGVFDSPYLAKIKTPSGRDLWFDQPEFHFTPNEQGFYRVDVWVRYAHEDPATGEPYVWHGAKFFRVGDNPNHVFADGFDSGDASAWDSQTTPGD